MKHGIILTDDDKERSQFKNTRSVVESNSRSGPQSLKKFKLTLNHASGTKACDGSPLFFKNI